MPPIQIPSTTTDPIVRDRGTITVYVRLKWTDPWMVLDYAEPLLVSRSVSPGGSHAAIGFKSGTYIKREDQANFIGGVEALKKLNYFCKIEHTATKTSTQEAGQSSPGLDGSKYPLFMGRFRDEEADVFSGLRGLGNPQDQTLTAYGFETEWDRQPIDSSWCINSTASGSRPPETPFEIKHPLIFNERFGIGLTNGGNRSLADFDIADTDPPRSSHVFTGKLDYLNDRPELWSNYNIVRYVLMRFTPTWMPIEMGETTDGGGNTVWDALHKVILPRYSIEGKTVKQVLDDLISRQRGFGWYLNTGEEATDPGGDGHVTTVTKFRLEVFTLVGEDVKVDDGILPANNNTTDVPVYSVINQKVTVSRDVLQKYGRVRVVGERMLTAFTASFADSTLEKAWTDVEETAYKNVSGDDLITKDHNREAAAFAHVFTTFQVPRNWDWKSGDGENSEKKLVNPRIDEATGKLNYTKASAALSRDWGHRLLRHLPLHKLQAKADTEAEFMEPLAFIKTSKYAEGEGSVDKWHYLHRMGALDQSCNVRPLDQDMGIELSMSPNHELALGTWTDWSGKTAKGPVYDYRKVAATVAVRTDQRLMVEVVIDENNDTMGTMKVIELPDAEIWLIVPGTVIDIKDGKPVKWTAAEWAKRVPPADQEKLQFPLMRDDSKRLRQIAALAKAWYGIERSTVRIELEVMEIGLGLGTYVKNIIQEPPSEGRPQGTTSAVNTTITQLSFNLQEMTTSISTGHCELDVTIRNKTAIGRPEFSGSVR